MPNNVDLNHRTAPTPNLETAATVMFIALCAVAIWVLLFGRPALTSAVAASPRAGRPPAAELPPSEPVSLDGATLAGTKGARVALIEYSDFQCPFCGKFARETLPDLEKLYVSTGKLVLAFRYLPLTQIHPFAQKAAEAAACAGEQDRFWSMHEQLFGDQAHLDVRDLEQRAKHLGLNVDRFNLCLDSNQTAARVQSDAASGAALGVSGTPTFFIGTVQADSRVKVTQRLSGAQPLAQFQAALDRALSSVESLKDRRTW